MRLEDMKKNIPETPEFIHRMIENEVKNQLQETKVISIEGRRRNKSAGFKAAVAVACLAVLSTAVYGGVRLYHMYLEKQGAYSVAVGIGAGDDSGEISIPAQIPGIDITAEYIPEGMEWMDEYHLQYPDHGLTGGFSFDSVLLDDNDLGRLMEHKSVVDSEERAFGDYEGVYLKYNNLTEMGTFDQRIYLLCPDVYRVVVVYIGDDIVKEEAIKVAENLVITENDKLLEAAGMYSWSEMVSPEELLVGGAFASVEDDVLPVRHIGEAFDIQAVGEDSDGNYMEGTKVSVCVDSVQVEKDLKLLGENSIPEEWINAVDSEGEIVSGTLSYIKSGDGVDTVDEIVKTETVERRLVYTTVTYTNETDKEINHLLYLGTLMLINHEDGAYKIYDPAEEAGKGYDRVIWDGAAKAAEMTYSSVSEDYGNGGNYISSLKPGESIQVNMAWIVNEKDLKNMYLNLNTDGGTLEFSDSMLENGLVNICQH